jgi:hypothetical protein
MAEGSAHDWHIAQLVGLPDFGKVEALQKAVYLAVDATDSTKDSGKVQDALDYLKQDYGLKGNITADRIATPLGEHQWYTHLGWDYDYRKELPIGWTGEMAQAQQDKYLLRKDILLHTVKKIFSNLSVDKINSIGALLYYTHMAGDLRWNNTPDNLITIPVLSSELEKHLKIAFGSQANGLINRIKENLKDVAFEDDAEPLDRVFDDLFGNVPGLIKNI